MHRLFKRILTLLLLGHSIAGVNRDVADYDDPPRTLSREATQILRLHFTTTHAYDAESSSSTRPKRSVSPSLCPPSDTCRGRCGQPATDFPFTCNCDPLCAHFSDCCRDYALHCASAPADDRLQGVPPLRCHILFRQFNLLVVDSCPDGYDDRLVRKLCASKLPKDCNFPGNLTARDASPVMTQCQDSVRRSCLRRLQPLCDVDVEAQCADATARQCSKLAVSQCRTCGSAFWPVSGEDGVLFRNSFCAMCHSRHTYTTLGPRDLHLRLKAADFLLRPCVPVDIDACPETTADPEAGELCRNHSGAVLAQGGKIYKNADCAACYGEDAAELRCATKAAVMRGLIRPLLETFITGDVQGMRLDDIPAAFSILLNFGLDGRQRMLFSSEGEEEMRRQQQRCGRDRIWDPFSRVCRRLFCSTEFVLVDYRCVRKETPDDGEPPGDEEVVLPDAAAEFVHLTLSAEVEMFDFLQFHGLDVDTVCADLRASLAHSFHISAERIRNVRFNISVGDFEGLDEMLRFVEEMSDFHPIAFQIDFDLFEDAASSEPSVDSIVSMLASSLSMNGFEFDIHNVTSRIFEIHQTVSPLATWCTPESGGRRAEFWNSEFSLVLAEPDAAGSQIEGLFVNKTGRLYPRGSFVADILFQGYQFSGSRINVSGVAVVCDWSSRLNESCLRILLHPDEYSIADNGSLLVRNASLLDASTYDWAENGSIWVCLESLKTVGNLGAYRMDMDVVQALVSFVLLWISVVALTVVLVTYFSFGSLRNLPGCNTMHLTASLLAMQVTFLFGQRGTVRGAACVGVAHLLHYETLCCFAWMNVMAFDLFRTFGRHNGLSGIRSKSEHLPFYVAYAYLCPLALVATASLLDHFLDSSPLAPRYGLNDVCWITRQHAAIAFFAVPLALVMIVNSAFFLLTILAMRSAKGLPHCHRKGRSDVFLYARMALVIGFTWALSFAAAFTRHGKLAGQVLTYLFIVFNTLQGVYIFCVFVCNRRVFELYREAFRNVLRKVSGRAKHESSSEVLTRLREALKRSVSSNTVVSTLSNTSVSSTDSRLPAVPE